MEYDPRTPTFTHAEVCAATGIPSATLQNWVNRGIVKIENANPGKSAKRLYSEIDIEYVLFVTKLSSLGIPPADACGFAAATIFKALDYNKNGDGEYIGNLNIDRLKRQQFHLAIINPNINHAKEIECVEIVDMESINPINNFSPTHPVIVFPFGYIRLELRHKLNEIRNAKA